jgi:dihydrolipoamide dehydrogenase
MSELQTIKVPDIGEFDGVEIIEVLVREGDQVEEESSLITVESDKASMEIPSPVAGRITSVLVKTGDTVSTGSDIFVIDVADSAGSSAGTSSGESSSDKAASVTASAFNASTPANASSTLSESKPVTQSAAPAASASLPDDAYDVVVVGAGPGGYTAAFRAADLGQRVLLIERYPDLGGVCLNVGCIPSKALLHTAAVINETREMAAHGITFGEPEIDIDKLRAFKDSVIGKLTGGLGALSSQRKVDVLHGVAAFESGSEISIKQDDGKAQSVHFRNAIIAAGSQSIKLPGFPYDDKRLMDSTGALELAEIPKRLLVIGGGIIGLEMGSVYAGLGSQVTVVELSPGLMPGCDKDLVRPLQKRLAKQFENIFLNAKVTAVESQAEGLKVSFEGGSAPETDTFDRVLLAIGRSPNGAKLNAEAAGVAVDERGYIAVDSQQRTNVSNIFAIGDIVGQPMLAHKATHEGKVAAEVIAGMKSHFDALTIPSVAYTDPEVAWMGLTETDALKNGTPYEKGVFPWAASGRALSMDRGEGLTKVLYDPETHRILGCGIVGVNAGELIAEAVLALEMGADIQDLALTVHPHPTLSESVNFAAEVAEGTVTDIYAPKKQSRRH